MEGRFDHNVAATGAQHKVVKLKGRSLQVLARLVADAANAYDVRWRALSACFINPVCGCKGC